MQIRESDLPGVGKKFAIVTDAGDRLSIIIHNTGHREIYNFRKGEDFPFHAIRLEDSEARKLGALLGGAYFQPTVIESMDMVLESLTIEWVKVDAASPLTGHTIAELEIRQRTGASVTAILRGGAAIPNPQPDQRIERDDTLMVVGTREQVQRFLDLFARAGTKARE
jgi:TrkA domain protein